MNPQPILAPNEYDGFPIVGDDSQLTRTVIVRINGAIDDADIGYQWKNNYVITEDHYIDYFGGRPAEEVVPMQILAKLRQSSCLFLGYALADWRLRVFLHWIWRVRGRAAPPTGRSSAAPTCSSGGSGSTPGLACTGAG